MTDLLARFASWTPELITAAGQTLYLTLAAFAGAAVLAIPICAMKMSKSASMRGFATSYIEVARGLPVLVILFIIYFGLPDVIPSFRWNSMSCAILGFALQGSALLAEIYRAGINAVERGEKEASVALGLTPLQALVHVTGPQAFRIGLPPMGNYLVGLLKDTSIASIIAAPELMLRAKDLSSSSFMPMPVYIYVSLFYLILSLPLSQLTRMLENKRVRQ
ncbi:MAG: amino acid ABC transporter permease [Rhizobiaceae bacterium]|nr:MAG: amino acid ABC transporter permease [Rhizobiaceae bacterium]CAG0961112.1 putative glutamine ABC transporter permease protein GlnM [Rhizobiaceae bacterium]